MAVAMTLAMVLAFAGQGLVGQPQTESPVAESPVTETAVTEPVVAVTPTEPTERPLEPTPVSSPPVPDPGPEGPWQLPEREWEALPTPTPQDDVWAVVQAVELLDEAPVVLSDCPPAQTISTEAEHQELVRQQWHCVHAAWVPLYERKGWSTVEPAIEFFPGTGTASECGYLEAPAFYCSAESGTVYFGAGHVEMAMKWDLSINEMVNHEYAHHVQSLAGITTAKVALPQTNEIERRAELQATCLSATMTRNSETIDFDQSDWDSWQERLESMIIDGIHGSRESILYWGTRGLYAETWGDCNTWAVDPEQVS